MKTAVVRAEIQRLIRQPPFRPFVLNLENGDRITIVHPENIGSRIQPESHPLSPRLQLAPVVHLKGRNRGSTDRG